MCALVILDTLTGISGGISSGKMDYISYLYS